MSDHAAHASHARYNPQPSTLNRCPRLNLSPLTPSPTLTPTLTPAPTLTQASRTRSRDSTRCTTAWARTGGGWRNPPSRAPRYTPLAVLHPLKPCYTSP